MKSSLARRAEQHAAPVRGAACRRVRRPRRVAQREVEVGGVRRLVGLPAGDGLRERELGVASGQRRADARAELARQRRAVERRGGVRLVRVHRLALDEQALDREQRRELVMRRLQRAHLGLDAEQLREEVLEVRRDGEQQVGLGLRRRAPSGRRGRRRAAPPARRPRARGARGTVRRGACAPATVCRSAKPRPWARRRSGGGGRASGSRGRGAGMSRTRGGTCLPRRRRRTGARRRPAGTKT